MNECNHFIIEIIIEWSYPSFAGITNHDEFSLVRDVPKEPREEDLIEKEKVGTLTLRRKDKMQTLKRKLKTDDDLNWVSWIRFSEIPVCGHLDQCWFFLFVKTIYIFVNSVDYVIEIVGSDSMQDHIIDALHC